MGEKQKTAIRAGKPGQDLVMAGYTALSGSAAVIGMERERLQERLPEELLEATEVRYAKLVQVMNRLAAEKQGEEPILAPTERGAFAGVGISAWYPMGEGGVLNALWDMAHQWNIGFTVRLKGLPVRQESIEVCEILGLNPYYLQSENSFLIAADHGSRLCQNLAKLDIPAAIIGVLTESNDKVLIHDDTVSHLNRPREDELERFLRERSAE